MILAPGVGVSGPIFMALDLSFGSRFHFLRFCFVEISFDVLLRFLLICWVFLLIGSLLCGFGAKSGGEWGISQDTAFRCNLKGTVLETICTIFWI